MSDLTNDLMARPGDADACDYVLRFRGGIGLDEPNVDSDLVDTETAELWHLPEDGPETRVGEIEYMVFRCKLAEELGEEIVEAADAHSGPAESFASAFLSQEDDDLPYLAIAVYDWSDAIGTLLLSLCLQRLQDYFAAELLAVVDHDSLPKSLEALGFSKSKIGIDAWWYRRGLDHPRP